ncbi:MAG: gamma carbonic anhydrase family protein [Chloroflexota bacterium]|nr:gamma carbonic anhydrase family protein [Chloroflexota bacterium]
MMIRSFGGCEPRMAATAFISEAAYIVGNVIIGEGSSVWPGAVIRADFAPIEIGNNTQIEDNCVLHAGMPLVIGDNVHVGHGAVVHCSRIGSNVLIGMNAVVLDGVEIGDYCVIGAGCVVPEGMKIPDKSFVVGVPGKIKGEISDSHVSYIVNGVEEYVKMTQKYKQAGL